jgi:hypothetical protein
LGTIKFSNKLFNRALSGTGFDTFINFDQRSYDETLSKELRIILESIKNDVFTKDLSLYWNKFVFTAIRYVLSEQLFVDWIYKTSYIRPVINAGELDQKDIYRFNDFGYVEDFIKEIKPFKSKIREFTVKQDYTEKTNLKVTDFDLSPYVNESGIVVVPQGDFAATSPLFTDWNENFAYSVKDIRISNPGNGYRVPPIVTIVADFGDTGSGATAFARISSGAISEIVVTNQGNGYLKTPRVVITGGGNYADSFEPATAYPVLGNTKVRNNSILMKFDRTSEKGLFTGEIVNRNLVTDGSTLTYLLTYPVSDTDTNYPALQDRDSIKVFLNDSELSSDTFKVTFRADLSTLISFNVALPANQRLRIQYIKNTLYTRDMYVQNPLQLVDTFKLTYPPELDPQKISIKFINPVTSTGSEISSFDYRIQLTQETVGFRKYVGSIKFKNIPEAGTIISIQYAKNINILNAVDRIITKYEPTVDMPGKDLQQLMRGVGFGGVEIQGLNFVVSSGWDGLPWFTQGWDTFVNEFKDLLVISDGVKSTYELGYVPVTGTNINVYFDGIRVDDENFNTVNQKNPSALFSTLLSDGATSTITLPVVPITGTKIEVRQSLSDGVTLPSDDIVLDTNLSGGDFTSVVDAGEVKFRTASGLRADDITVDGGQFLSVEHSPSTEELIKSEIFDTLSISVFNSPNSGSNQIETYQFQFDGSVNQFVISGIPDSDQSIDVYIGNFLADRSGDYTVTVNQDNTTTIDITTANYGISSASIDNKIVITIQKISIGGSDILHKQVYNLTAQDAASDIISIETPVNITDIGSYYISTSKVNKLEKLSARSKRSKIVIENTSPKLTEGTPITIILFSASVKSYSEVYNQEITVTNQSIYALERPPGNIEPLHVMAISTRLTPSTINWTGRWKENNKYVIDDTVVYKNISYSCKKSHVSFSENSTVSVIWENEKDYTVDDIVIFGTNVFICTVAHESNVLTIIPDNTQYWELLTVNVPGFDEYWQELPKQRMIPAETEYYEVVSANQTFNLGQNVPYLPRSLTSFDIEVYKNGRKLTVGRDYDFNFIENLITLSPGTFQIGDVVAIAVLKNADYLIRNGNVIFTNKSNIKPDQRIIITTYTNHDENLMRREVFKGNQTRNEYKLSRPVFSIDNIWVDLNGSPLIPNVYYRIMDRNYVKLSEKISIENTDRIVVTSISDVNSGPSVAYKIFKDMTNSYQFKRISKKASTVLTKDLLPTDREIEVADATIFGVVTPSSKTPGVLFIAGERIEFRRIVGNVLQNLTRGTRGTGVASSYLEGTKLFNDAQSETVPYREGNIVNTFKTPTGYRFNQETTQYEKLVNGNYIPATDIGQYTLSNCSFREGIPYEDQISVYMASRVLLKPARNNSKLVTHDFSITLYSDEVNSEGISGETEIVPDFTIEKQGETFVLKINPSIIFRTASLDIIPDIQIRAIQKIGKIWYTLNGLDTVQEDGTVQAKFLQNSAAELPDKFVYANRDITN